jgi:hypothetical protein
MRSVVRALARRMDIALLCKDTAFDYPKVGFYTSSTGELSLVARESCASAEMAQRSLIRAFYFRRSDKRMPHGSYPSSGPPLSGSHLNGCVHMAAISIAFVSIGHAFRSVSPTRSRVVGLRGYETTNFMKVPNRRWYALPV